MSNATFNESNTVNYTHTYNFFLCDIVIRKFHSVRTLLVMSPNIPSFTYCCTCQISRTTIFKP